MYDSRSSFVEFLSKSNTAKLSSVKKNGLYLTSRVFHNYNIDLFSLDNFFVEMWRSNRTHGVVIVQAYPDAECLDEYLKFVDVSDIAKVM